jgi:hypothetical protein
MDEIILRDDESSAGLRRLHVIASVPALLKEHERKQLLEGWERRWLAIRVNGGRLECKDLYEDGSVSGLWHLRLYWRMGS